MRAAVDCNVVVSGAMSRGTPPAAVLDAMLAGRVEPILSPAVFREYDRVLRTPKVRRYTRLAGSGLEGLLAALSVVAFWVEDRRASPPIVAADPDDDMYLLAAVDGQAGAIVSGDRHLLALRAYEGIPIVAPRDFLESLPR